MIDQPISKTFALRKITCLRPARSEALLHIGDPPVTFHILDPNLAHDNGHQMEWEFAIASTIQHEGEAVRIFANKKFSQSLKLNDVTIVPHFTHTTYETHSKDRFTSAHDDFHFFNDTLQRELSNLPRESFAPSDTVLAPTLSENHLLGYVNWMKSFDAAAAPLFVVHLMFPSGLSIETGGGTRSEERRVGK